MKTKSTDAPIVHAATELHAAIEEIETLTRRAAKSDLTTRNELVRAGQLLTSAAEAHGAFLRHLHGLSEAVNALRERQNASASALTQEAERLDARRVQHESFEERFAAIGGVAREIAETVKGIEEPTSPEARDAAHATLAAIEERLSGAAEDARALAADAREASFTELERQAHAMSQQLHALQQKLRAIAPS